MNIIRNEGVESAWYKKRVNGVKESILTGQKAQP